METQSLVVLTYYAMLGVLCVFIYYAFGITWWSSFNLSLLITFIVIVFTAPEQDTSKTTDAVFLFLLLLIAFAAPVFLFVYIVSQALQDKAL